MFKSRKELRKEKRIEKKAKRANAYLNRKCRKNQISEQSENQSEQNKISNTEQSSKQPVIGNKKYKNKDKKALCTDDRILLEAQRKRNEDKKLQKAMNRQRIKQLLEANEEEDKTIKSLEKKLKMNKRKTKSLPKAFIDEGLDYLLELCDGNTDKNVACAENNSDSDFNSDLESLRKNNKDKRSKLRKKVNEKEKKPVKNSCPNSNASNNVQDRMKRLQEMVDSHSNKKQKTLENSNRNDSNSEDESNDDYFDYDDESNAEDNNNFVDGNGNRSDDIDDNSNGSDNIDNNGNGSDNIDNNGNGSDETDSNCYSDEEDDETDASSDADENGQQNKKSDRWEDIYGRIRDSEGNIVQASANKYIPPHQKRLNIDDTRSKQLGRLSKQLKGFMNRLTESNMHSISHQIEGLYMSHSHNDINETIVSLLTTSLISNVLSPESIVMEHAMLIALLHANIGEEIGAYILQNFVGSFVKSLNENVEIEDKRIDNLLFFICHLYNFKIFSSDLLFDILKKLADKFEEKEIELILLALRCVGFVLRKDDPHSLKELIITLQTKARESEYLRESARVRFMLDTVMAIKNNNMAKIPQFDSSKIEHLKKIMKSMLRTGRCVTELKITLDDITNAETRGRWWIVGSAWKDDDRFKINKTNEKNDSQMEFSKEIIQLAKQQRMNTDTRKNIFCILMSAEDYLDAFEKLIRLGLKGPQHREIINVLIHCLLREKHYNPYYMYLAEHLCSHNRIYQLAIQFSMWDRFKEINSLSSLQITHISKFLSYLFLEGSLSLTVLKVIQFTDMNKPLLKLIRRILLNLLLCESEEKLASAFHRISKSPSLSSLRQSLQVFLHHFILKNVGNETNFIKDSSQIELLPTRVALVEKAMNKFVNDYE